MWGECIPEPGCRTAEGSGTHGGEWRVDKETSRGGVEGVGGCIDWQKVREVGGFQLVEECLKVNTVLDREPV